MENVKSIAEFAGDVIATAAIVLGVLWRLLNKMITDKIREQLAVVTQATSKAVEDLRTELHKHANDSDTKSEERAERITKRIDSLYELLSNRK